MEKIDSKIWENKKIQGQTAIMWLYGGGGVLVLLLFSLALIFKGDNIYQAVGLVLLFIVVNYLNKITVSAVFVREHVYLRTVFSKRKILYSELLKLEFNHDRNILGNVALFHLKKSNFFKPKAITLCLNESQFLSFREWLFEETEFPRPIVRRSKYIRR